MKMKIVTVSEKLKTYAQMRMLRGSARINKKVEKGGGELKNYLFSMPIPICKRYQ